MAKTLISGYKIQCTSQGKMREVTLTGRIPSGRVGKEAAQRLTRIAGRISSTRGVVVDITNLQLLDGCPARALGVIYDACKRRDVPFTLKGAKGQPLTMLHVVGRDRDLLPTYCESAAS